MNRVLHLGCGRKATLTPSELFRYVALDLAEEAEVVNLDADARNKPDIVCELGRELIDLPDDSIDMAIAWHVLEHIGRQGDVAEWFAFWEDLYRVLKPGGLIYGECPYYTGIWAWSDPTHVRALSEHSFVFFNQDSYRIPDSAISPYRLACDFQFSGLRNMERGHRIVTDHKDPRNQVLRFCLSARKPLLTWWAANDLDYATGKQSMPEPILRSQDKSGAANAAREDPWR